MSDNAQHDVDAEVRRYLAKSKRDTQKALFRTGLVFSALALLPLALSTQVNDIGHAVGFAGLSVLFVVGAANVFHRARKNP